MGELCRARGRWHGRTGDEEGVCLPGSWRMPLGGRGIWRGPYCEGCRHNPGGLGEAKGAQRGEWVLDCRGGLAARLPGQQGH
jgi:hypothetical protein